MQTIDPFGIMTTHPIPKRLVIRARLLRSSLAAHGVEDMRHGYRTRVARHGAIQLKKYHHG